MTGQVYDRSTKWFAAALTLGLWLATWPQILPEDADLPPCHMMVLIGASGLWTARLLGRDHSIRKRSRRPKP